MKYILLFLFFAFPHIEGQGLLGGLGDLGNLGRQLGFDMNPGHGDHRGHGGHGGQEGQGLLGGLGGQGINLNGMVNQFLAPSPHSDIPPHVYRRIVRFCSRHPDHPKCMNHPEWVHSNVPKGSLLGGLGREINEMFPELVNFKLPPIPKINLPDVLRNVPDILKTVIPAPILGQLTDLARNAIRTTCSASGACKKQRPEILNQRATIAEQESQIWKIFGQGKSQGEVDQLIETRLARTHQVKKALLKRAGLDNDIEPENDGAFQKDILLTEEQANTMINEIESGSSRIPASSPSRPGRFQRSALFLETTPTQRWSNDRPIQYMFDQTLSEADKSAVRAAIKEIESKTCVRFKFETKKPPNSHIYYVKTAASSVCGLSYIGRVEPVNTIYLTFACGNPIGVAVHETLHALGLNHEQLRGDRDQFIKVNWENVNPQNYDFFAIADSKQFTSYGVKYDYGSIMHYNQYIASQYPTKPSMTAKVSPQTNNALMGQRKGLSARDIEIVNKMYCVPGCDDKNVYCGTWALAGYCTSAGQKGWMEQNCKKSCNLC
ncbi:hypothetical protein FO519_007008 [Halicephalobus sp. NKZ332]|nr:hypothetical protein FO519_007008 [Halicephalobus sp. NKZ332]